MEVLTKVAGCYPKVSGPKVSAREQEKTVAPGDGGFVRAAGEGLTPTSGGTSRCLMPAWACLVPAGVHTLAKDSALNSPGSPASGQGIGSERRADRQAVVCGLVPEPPGFLRVRF